MPNQSVGKKHRSEMQLEQPNETMSQIAIFASDIHLSHTPPAARSAEPDWYAAMAKQLAQLTALTQGGEVPVIYTGDIFDKWNSPPELINFAIKHLPSGYAIPGQHDLPHHDLSAMKRSAYWTMVEAKKLINLEYGKPKETHHKTPIRLHGFPFGTEVKPLKKAHDLLVEVAVIHAYIWTKKTGYAGASGEQRLVSWLERLAGYDVAAFGDNHNGFISSAKPRLTIVNCGGFMRRRSDEIDRAPFVGVLHSDNRVEKHYLDTAGEKFMEVENEKLGKLNTDMDDFIRSLKGLEDVPINFSSAVKRYLETNDVADGVREILTKVIG